MSQPRITPGRIFGIVVLLGFLAIIVWGVTRPPKRPSTLRIELAKEQLEWKQRDQIRRRDAALVKQLLAEDLGERRFSFATVVHAVSGREMLSLDPEKPSHRRTVAAIDEALATVTAELSQPGSPVRELRRINEASRIFEDALMEKLAAVPGLSCEVPPTREGKPQRSGYPDLKLTDATSGDVFYLDPKLFEEKSRTSSLRTFYFEPKDTTLKINDDAVHLLVGISHDGKTREWTFGEWKIVDLSKLQVRLKAEFQASNIELYQP